MRRFLRHVAATSAAAAALGALSTGSAVAAPPDRYTEHVDDTFLSSTSEDCGFDILLHIEGTLTWTDFYDQQGNYTRSFSSSPGLFYTFINADTGVSVASRSPDIGHFTWNPDGSFTAVITGLVLHVDGDQRRAVQAGQFSVVVDADGNAVETEPLGANEDYHAALCSILAP